MKKHIVLCICTTMIVSTLNIDTIRAAEIVRQWNYSDADDGAIVATLTDDGLMSISGNGWCNPPGDNNFWKGWEDLGYNDAIKEVIYSEGIKSTGPSAFYTCQNLENVTLPSTLKEIERYAFSHTNIQEISIPDSVTVIDDYAFMGCKQLQSVRLPESLTQLGEDVFSVCTNLEQVVIDCPALEILEQYTFQRCDNLYDVKIEGGLKEIEYDVFSQCKNLKSITLPDGLERIDRAFKYCYKLTNITIPKSVTYIDQYAFDDVPGPIGVYCGSYALRRCKEKGWPYYIVDAEENRPEILDDLQYEYYKDVQTDIQIPVDMKGATKLTEVRIGSSVVPTDNYNVENGTITVSSDYLQTLDANKYSLSLTFNDCAVTTLSVKLYVYEKASDREAPYLIQDTIKFDGSDVELKFDPGKGDLETTSVLSLVIDSTIILPGGDTLPLSKTNVRDIIAAYEASLELDEPFIEEIPEDVIVATPSEPVRPATPSEPIKPVTPSEPARPATPSEPVRPATPSEPDHLASPSEPIRSATPSKPRKLSRKEKRIHQLSTLLAAIDNGSDMVFWVDGSTITLSGEYITDMNLSDGNHLIGAIFDNTERTTDLKKVVLIVGESEEPEKPPVPEEPEKPPMPEEPERPLVPEDTNIQDSSSDEESSDANYKPSVPDSGGEFEVSGTDWEYIKPDGTLAKDEWVLSEGDWYYIGSDSKLKHGWYVDNASGDWYMLNNEHDGEFGAALSGWYYEPQDSKWYYLDPADNKMLTGWHTIDSKWYYFTEHNTAPTYSGNNLDGWDYTPTTEIRPYGSMYCNEYTPDGYAVDDTGSLIK